MSATAPCPICREFGVTGHHNEITEEMVDRVAWVLSHKGPEENEDTNFWQLADEALHAALFGDGRWLG